MNTLSLNKRKTMFKAVTIITAVASAVALPQLFHAIGAVSGVGAGVGAAFLPMHIPVILAGLLGGSTVGLTVGILSPLVSFVISGMPSALILPFMIVELAVYGLVSGMLSEKKLNNFAKLLTVQLSGRVARALAVIFAVSVLGNPQLTIESAYTFITAGLFGIILQWAVIPSLAKTIETFKEKYE